MTKMFALLLRTSAGRCVSALLCALVSGAAGIGLVALINQALARQGLSTGPAIGAFAGLGLALLISKIGTQVLLLRVSQSALFDLRMDLSQGILKAPLGRLEAIGAPRLLASLTDDVPAAGNGLLLVPELLINTAVVASCLAYLGWLSWPVLLGLVAFVSLGILGYQLAVSRALISLRSARQEQDALLTHFRALTEGTKELKLNRSRRESFLERTLRSTASALKHHNVAGLEVYMSAASGGQLLFLFLIGGVLVAFPALTEASGPVVSGYIVTILFGAAPLENIVKALPTLGQASVALATMARLRQALAATPGESDGEARPAVRTSGVRIDLVGVTHAYRRDSEDGEFVLGPIDLTLEAGEVVFLVGGNGSGKTTLAKILTGLYTPVSGEIRMAGRSIGDETREWYREHFSAVFSDFFLFDSAHGGGGSDLDGRARHYLRQFELEHKVEIRDGAFSSTALSRGQRKRLALIGAYLEDRPVYVFDEWAADQDPSFKKRFYEELIPDLKRRGKTVLVVTHDEYYFDRADRIVKLEEGRVSGGRGGTKDAGGTVDTVDARTQQPVAG